MPSEAPPPYSLAEFIRLAQDRQESVVDLAQELTADGTKKVTVALSRRNLNPEPPATPIKSPSPKREHVIYDVEGFAAYLQKFGTENTVVLANPLQGKMSAILDETSKDGFEVVGFEPMLHPLFEPWSRAMFQKQILIRDFVDFVASNRMSIAQPTGRDLLLAISQVRLSKNIELYQSSGASSLNGILVRTKVASGDDRAVSVELPESITIKAPIFVGTDAQEIIIDLMVGGTEQDGVFVRLSSGDLLQKKSDAFQRMFNDIRAWAPQTTIAMGSPNHQDWKFLTR